MNFTKLSILFSFITTIFSSSVAKAEEVVGMAKQWQINFQEPASPVMEKLVSLHNSLLYMTFGVSIFVLVLLLYVMVKFRRSKNPVPSKTTHNAVIEIIWTAVPVLILVAIVIPSWRLIHYTHRAEDAEITIKAIGYQWYWGYEYMDGDGKGIAFESYMKLENPPKGSESLQLLEGEPRLLATDRNVVVPVDTNIRLLTTSADVIHSFAMPSFGVKIDAVPGRVNESWFRATKRGIFYGQCSELCGAKHAFMPIAIKVVTKEEYRDWVAKNDGELSELNVAEATSENLANENTINN